MAVDIYSGKQTIGFLQQSKVSNHWSAPQAASANFKKVNYDKNVSIPNPDVQIENFNWTAQTGTMLNSSRVFVDSTSGLPSVPFSGVMTKSLMGLHLACAMHTCTEGATTPFDKSFTMANHTGQVDFATNEGFLSTIAGYAYAAASDGWILQNALLNELKIVIEANQRGVARLANVSGTWVGNNLLKNQNLSGSWVAQPTTGFYNVGSSASDIFAVGMAINLLGSALSLSSICWRRFELTINNNVMSDCKTTGGKANNFKIDPVVTFSLDIPYNSASYTLLKEYTLQNADYCEMTLANSYVANTDGEFAIAIPNFHMTENPKVFEGDYLAHRINGIARDNGTNSPLTIDFTDTVDWGF